MGLCCASVGVGWGSDISEVRGQGLISKGWVVTLMGQGLEALRALGVVAVEGMDPEGSGSLICMPAQ